MRPGVLNSSGARSWRMLIVSPIISTSAPFVLNPSRKAAVEPVAVVHACRPWMQGADLCWTKIRSVGASAH